MSFYIYGLRVRGDPECRYVGMTSRQPDDRLRAHASQAASWEKRAWGQPPDPEGFTAWLTANKGNIEAFKIAKAETKAEARITERAIANLILRLDHRLFNTWLIPADKRIAWKAQGYGQRAADMRRRRKAAA